MKMDIKKALSNKKGIAGLDILLQVVAFIFAIGLTLMIFLVMAQNLEDNTSIRTPTTVTLANQSTLTAVNESGVNITGTTGFLQCGLTVISAYGNATEAVPQLLDAANYTTNGCAIFQAAAQSGYNNTVWNVTGSYGYLAANEATASINATKQALTGADDFFSIMILIASMVVLVLLVVIIIRSIRGGAFTGGGGA